MNANARVCCTLAYYSNQEQGFIRAGRTNGGGLSACNKQKISTMEKDTQTTPKKKKNPDREKQMLHPSCAGEGRRQKEGNGYKEIMCHTLRKDDPEKRLIFLKTS